MHNGLGMNLQEYGEFLEKASDESWYRGNDLGITCPRLPLIRSVSCR